MANFHFSQVNPETQPSKQLSKGELNLLQPYLFGSTQKNTMDLPTLTKSKSLPNWFALFVVISLLNVTTMLVSLNMATTVLDEYSEAIEVDKLQANLDFSISKLTADLLEYERRWLTHTEFNPQAVNKFQAFIVPIEDKLSKISDQIAQNIVNPLLLAPIERDIESVSELLIERKTLLKSIGQTLVSPQSYPQTIQTQLADNSITTLTKLIELEEKIEIIQQGSFEAQNGQVQFDRQIQNRISIACLAIFIFTLIYLIKLTFVLKQELKDNIANGKALQQAERRLSSILNAAADGVITITAKGIIETINPAVTNLLGYRSQDLIGKNVKMLMPEQYSSEHDTYLDNYMQTEHAKVIGIGREVLAKSKEGLIIPVELAVNVFEFDNQKKFVGILRDISERVDSEQKLRLIQSALDQAAIGVFFIDHNAKFVYANKASSRMLKYNNDQLMGFSVFDINAVVGRHEWASIWNINKMHGSRVQRTKHRTSEGQVIDVELVSYYIAADEFSGQSQYPEGLVITFSRDISKEIESEQKLKDSEERFELAVNGSADGIWDWDILTNKVYFSPRFKALLGYADDEYANNFHTWFSCLHPEDTKATEQAINHHLEQREPYDILYRMKNKGGNYEWFRAKGQAVWNEQGKPYRMAGSISDVTELKMAMQQAEQASKAKSEFVATMSHEVRTPLNGVLGMAQLLAKTELNEQQQQFVNSIQNSGELLLSILNDILDYSKIEAGKLNLDVRPLNIQQVIKQVVDIFCARLAEKSLQLKLITPTNLPSSLLGDPMRLQQILANLLSNAIKFTDQGEITIEVALRYFSEEACLLNISISDSGIGMTQQQVAKVFDKFSQADGSTTRKYGGTGLGLSICNSLLGLMDSELNVRSEQGAGSTFSFDVKLPVLEFNEALQHSSVIAKRVLLVDDYKVNRQVYIEMLSSLQLEFVEVNSAEQAREQLKGSVQPFDLLILDCMMPDEDGLSLLRWIKTQPDYQSIPVVMASSNMELGAQQLSIELGVSCFYTKPIHQDKVIGSVTALLNRQTTTTILTEDNLTQPKPASSSVTPVSVSSVSVPSTAPTTGLSVLLVDDTEINRVIATAMLEGMGHKVSVANNGQEAVQLCSQQVFDLIFMDCVMPVLDGFDATIQIRELEQNKGIHTPILALTANALSDVKEKCFAAGMDDFLTKPFKEEELKAATIKVVAAKVNRSEGGG